jgi:hypothetical protein
MYWKRKILSIRENISEIKELEIVFDETVFYGILLLSFDSSQPQIYYIKNTFLFHLSAA